jgi:hypothetical protein
VRAEEVRLTKEELVPSGITLSKMRCDDGWSGEVVSSPDGTVRSTGRCKAGIWSSDEGTWSIVDSAEGWLWCIAWKNHAPACWRQFKDGDRYVSYEVGGSERTCWGTRSARPN